MGFEFKLVHCKEHTRSHPQVEEEQGGSTVCFECATRLFHEASGTMITAANRCEYIPDGEVFDEISRLCQETAQERVKKECSLETVTLYYDETRGEPVHALVDAKRCRNGDGYLPSWPTFLFITGKGKSRMGIVSVKEVLVSGIEKGSALFHLEEAQKRGLSVVCLDPNALGEHRGMEVVNKSLDALFGSWEGGPVFVLAHSAAGGYLVRYLLLGAAREQLLPYIHAIAFTDSTHWLPWARDEPQLFSFLQSAQCIYIRNDTARTAGAFGGSKANAEPGEEADVDIWWCQRFGELRTVWAGTTEHSAMCWVARGVIWDFFDNNLCNRKVVLLDDIAELDARDSN